MIRVRKLIGTRSLLQTISILDPDDRMKIVAAAPMGVVIYDDFVRPLSQYLKDFPAPKCRLQEVQGMHPEDLDRLEFGQSVFESMRTAIVEGADCYWEEIRRAVSRVYGFLVAARDHEGRIAESLQKESPQLDSSMLVKAVGFLDHAAESAKNAFSEAKRAVEEGDSADVRERLGSALQDAVQNIGSAVAVYKELEPAAEEALPEE